MEFDDEDEPIELGEPDELPMYNQAVNTIKSLRTRVAELESLAYPDGPSGDAGISCKRYMALEAENAKLKKDIAEIVERHTLEDK